MLGRASSAEARPDSLHHVACCVPGERRRMLCDRDCRCHSCRQCFCLGHRLEPDHNCAGKRKTVVQSFTRLAMKYPVRPRTHTRTHAPLRPPSLDRDHDPHPYQLANQRLPLLRRHTSAGSGAAGRAYAWQGGGSAAATRCTNSEACVSTPTPTPTHAHTRTHAHSYTHAIMHDRACTHA